MKLLKIFTLAIILFLGLLARLYKIDSPIADWHSWRQADTAAVTRNFIKEGFNPLLPKYDDMSGVSEKTPVINPQRFRFVEFPLYNIAVYPLYLLFGTDVKYDRLVSIIFSLGSITLIFFIVKKYAGAGAAFLSAFTFALLPFNVFFSRTTLPEPTFVFFALGMLYFMDRWIWESKSLPFFLGFIFTAMAFLIKPWAIFFFLPLLYSLYKRRNRKIAIKFILFTATALLPFILWRLWMLQQGEGIPASSWLLNADGIRFRPAFWWWIVSERLGREILGATGMVLFFIGLLVRPKNGNYFLHILALSGFLFITIFATGNVRHNYYQIQFIPAVSIFFSLGFIQLLSGNRLFIPRILTIPLAFFLFSLSFFFSYKIVSEFYKINNPDMVEAGHVADRILPKDAVVLAPYNGDSAFLYQTNRPGFPQASLPIPDLVTDYGVSAYVSTTKDDKTNWILKHFEVLFKTDKFVIADLTKLKYPLSSLDPEP